MQKSRRISWPSCSQFYVVLGNSQIEGFRNVLEGFVLWIHRLSSPMTSNHNEQQCLNLCCKTHSQVLFVLIRTHIYMNTRRRGNMKRFVIRETSLKVNCKHKAPKNTSSASFEARFLCMRHGYKCEECSQSATVIYAFKRLT